jgi:hypothetical protein
MEGTLERFLDFFDGHRFQSWVARPNVPGLVNASQLRAIGRDAAISYGPSRTRPDSCRHAVCGPTALEFVGLPTVTGERAHDETSSLVGYLDDQQNRPYCDSIISRRCHPVKQGNRSQPFVKSSQRYGNSSKSGRTVGLCTNPIISTIRSRLQSVNFASPRRSFMSGRNALNEQQSRASVPSSTGCAKHVAQARRRRSDLRRHPRLRGLRMIGMIRLEYQKRSATRRGHADGGLVGHLSNKR